MVKKHFDYKKIFQIQAEPTIRFASCDDKKLADWLKKIYPAVSIELSKGVTDVYEGSKETREPKKLKISKYQEIDLKKLVDNDKSNSIVSSSCWLSVFTQNAPILAISCSQSDYAEQKSAFLIIYEPKRTNAEIFWKELQNIPVKSQIEVLATCSYNKDFFAAGTTSGDLYIWNYQNTTSVESENRVCEIFSQSNDQGGITSLAWMRPTLGISFGLLSAHKDGSILLWKVNKQKTVLDKIFRIEIRGKNTEVTITCICGIPNSDLFVVGTLEGLLLLCSLTQIIPIPDTKFFNPVIQELQSHQFGIKMLGHCSHEKKSYVISNSSDGEIYFHQIEDLMDPNPKLVIKLPLPFKGNICVSNNLENIFCPGDNGILEVFNINSNVHDVIEGHQRGKGNLISLSDNQ